MKKLFLFFLFSIILLGGWEEDGNVVCNAVYTQKYPEIMSDGSGGAIITWYDYRTSYADIYAQKIYTNGQVGIEEKNTKDNYPNIFIDYISFKGYEKFRVSVYNIAGSRCGEYYGDMVGKDLEPGIYFVKIKDRLYKVLKIR